MKVLFVCRGNVGRSQMAEALFNQLAALTDHKAVSAGTKVKDKEGNDVSGEMLKDRPGAAHVVAAMAEVNIDVRDNVRDQLDSQMVEDADLVVSMAEEETIPPYLKETSKVRYWSFPDPKNATLEEVQATRDAIRAKVTELFEEISGK